MEFPRYSKSLDTNAFRCAWYAHEVHVLGNRPPRGEGAAIGLEVEDWFTKALHDELLPEDVWGIASSERIARMVQGCVRLFPLWEFRRLFHSQVKVGLDLNGAAIPFDGAPIVAILDLIGVLDNTCYVIDIKAGKFRDNPPERTLYTYTAKALFPEVERFKFIYLHPHVRAEWTYQYVSPRTVLVGADPLAADTDRERLTARGKDPLFKLVLDRITEIKAMPLAPRFSDECYDMYGSPCPFIGNDCPAADFVPTVLPTPPKNLPSAIASGLLSLPLSEQPGAAFLALHWGLDVAWTPELMALAKLGVEQVRAGATAVHDKIKRFSKDTGQGLQIGKDIWGWRPKQAVDAVAALQMMLNVMEPEDLAKTVSISPSTIDRISDAKYPGLADAIRLHCISDADKEEWGRIKG